MRRILWIHFRMFYMKGFVKRVSIRGLTCKNCTQQSRYGTSFAIVPGKKKEKTRERVAQHYSNLGFYSWTVLMQTWAWLFEICVISSLFLQSLFSRFFMASDPFRPSKWSRIIYYFADSPKKRTLIFVSFLSLMIKISQSPRKKYYSGCKISSSLFGLNLICKLSRK